MRFDFFMWNLLKHKSYFLWKAMKNYLWMSSAAVMIGTWRVKIENWSKNENVRVSSPESVPTNLTYRTRHAYQQLHIPVAGTRKPNEHHWVPCSMTALAFVQGHSSIIVPASWVLIPHNWGLRDLPSVSNSPLFVNLCIFKIAIWSMQRMTRFFIA